MKILFLYANLMHDFNDTFKEFRDGMCLANVSTVPCPKEITYNTVKGHDVVIIDSPFQLMRKANGYLPTIVDKDVHKLKLGIYTMDYFGDLTRTQTHRWLTDNKVSDFVIFRHSSGLEAYKDPSTFNHNNIQFLYKSDASVFWNKFDHAFLAPFTINKDRMVLGDKERKLYDVCLGANVVPGYPLRGMIKSALNKGGFHVIDPQHKGAVREFYSVYYRGIAASWLAVATTGVGNISVRKHYEICGLGTTCLGNTTGLYDHDIVKLNTVCLDTQDVKPKVKVDEIYHMINKALRNKDKLISMVDSVKEVIRFTYDYRFIAQKLVDDIGKIYG
jgi:hypothetical protein